MKKIMLFMSAMLIAAGITSCGGSTNTNSSSSSENTQATKEAPQQSVSSDNQLKIVNTSGYDFECILMSPSSDDEWADILAEDDTFDNNEEAQITLEASKNQAWDIRLAQDAGDVEDGYIEFSEIDLTGISTIELITENGELYYRTK